MTETPATPAPDSIAALHFLLVDDDQMFLNVLQALLASLGATNVTRATNGSDAYAKLSKSSKVVDCILCDYSMEAGNGLQLLQAIRSGQIKVIRPDTCFILITGSRDALVVDAAAQLDVNGYLVKPVKAATLHAAVLKGRARVARIDFERYRKVTLPEAP